MDAASDVGVMTGVAASPEEGARPTVHVRVAGYWHRGGGGNVIIAETSAPGRQVPGSSTYRPADGVRRAPKIIVLSSWSQHNGT